jgi:short-subunit dehydrogenase
MPSREIAGARIAVLGASGALGSRIARELAARGARLLLVGRDDAALEALGLDAERLVVADVAEAGAGDAVADAARERLGGLDGLVNAVGVVAFGPLVDTDDAVLEELFLTNVVGPLAVLRRVLPLLQESKGVVVNLSAVVAERPLPGMVAYSATKAALTAADAALRPELRRSGVHVLDVRPPHTETGLAGRPIGGEAPRLPQGLDPDAVARRVVDAIEAGEDDLPSDGFGRA